MCEHARSFVRGCHVFAFRFLRADRYFDLFRLSRRHSFLWWHACLPIHTELLSLWWSNHHDHIVKGANAFVPSSCAPDDTTFAYKFLRMSASRFMLNMKIFVESAGFFASET